MLSEIPGEQFANVLEDCAREVLAEGAVEGPPVDAIRVARRLQLVVARDSSMDERARYVRIGERGRGGRGTILLAEDPRAERRQWAVAHELGEYAAHRVFAVLGISVADIPPSGREVVANRLASCLLLPREWFAADGMDLNWDLYELKSRYSTASHELIARRMLEMSPPVMLTVFDQGRMTWRRSNMLRRPPRMTPPEESTWRVAFDGGQSAEFSEACLPEGIAEIRCWPIHEPGWQREILRTALEDW